MKKNFLRLVAAAVLAVTGVSCTTAYDHYGRPRQVVDPGMAALGAVAAGVAGYAIADSRNRNQNFRGHKQPRYSQSHYNQPRYVQPARGFHPGHRGWGGW